MPPPYMCRKCLLSMVGRHEGLHSALSLMGSRSAVIIRLGLLQFRISIFETGLALAVGVFLFLTSLST